ncbi:MAG: DNA-directed RNA polymerase specialized sigma subunit, sigma24 family [Verrucomicrobia bacterium]|nr:MAG: DNA-directed RNA polymerase specialized sigma subunit, sigma24 family [Verrucomicrobiota bacterium]
MDSATPDIPSDSDLLTAYAKDGNESAFATLAARHVDMIFSVSLRRSNHRQLAEEATQNVLLALSINARKLAHLHTNLPGWLHTATKFEVAKLQRRESRLKKREQAYAASQMNPSQHEVDTVPRLLPLLDKAIDQLCASDRDIIVRRYLEGHDFRRIGEALGISEDTAQKRTSRAFDSLNRFFKRHAGITVSATALAAGIRHHCAEAAPAACLQFAAKAAPAGLASILSTTTLTTMSIGKLSALTAGILGLVGTVVFLTSPDKPRPDSVSTFSPASPAPPTPSATQPPDNSIASSTASAATTPENANPFPPEDDPANLEALSPHPGPEELVRRLSVKHQQLTKDLTADLNLSDSQVTTLTNVLDTRLKSFRASLDMDAAQGTSPEEQEKTMLTNAGSLIRGTDLRKDLTGFLSEPQLAAFDAREAKVHQSNVESLAYRELATISPVLNLNEAQKNRAFELLQSSSAEKLKQDGDFRAFMALQKNQSPAQMELTDLAEADFLSAALDGPNPLPPESPEFKKQILDVVGTQIRKQLALLAPILDQKQQQRYLDHLVSKSLLPQFDIELPATPQK